MKNNDCKYILSKLKKYLDGELSESETASVEEHLRECEECKRSVDNMEDQNFVSQDKKIMKGLKKLKLLFYFKVALISVAAVAFSLLFINFIGPEIMRNVYLERDLNYQRAILDNVMLKKFLASDVHITHKPGLLKTVIECEYSSNIFGENISKKKERFILPNIFGKVEHKTDLDLLYGKKSDKLGWIELDNFLTEERYGNRYKKLGEQFDKLENSPQGTITQAIVIFKKPYKVEELPDILRDIGDVKLEYCWFSVETGFQKLFDADKDGDSIRFFITHPVGFSVFTPEDVSTNTRLEYRRDMFYRGLKFDMQVKYPATLFEKEFAWIESNYKYFFDLYKSGIISGADFKQEDFEEAKKVLSYMKEYIKTNGISVKTAIITAPTQNMLKLRNNDNLLGIEIINVDFDY